jgi:hypothetical protein
VGFYKKAVSADDELFGVGCEVDEAISLEICFRCFAEKGK